MSIHTDIPEDPEDRLEPKAPVLFRCPLCGLEQEVTVCKCGDPICGRCDPDPEMHIRCMPPERRLPWDLLTDVRLCLLRVRLALGRGEAKRAIEAVKHMEDELIRRGVA